MAELTDDRAAPVVGQHRQNLQSEGRHEKTSVVNGGFNETDAS
jgi:hypothetical protein